MEYGIVYLLTNSVMPGLESTWGQEYCEVRQGLFLGCNKKVEIEV